MRVLITGVTGQIGWYAAEQALDAGHEVFGLVRGQGAAVVPEGVQVLRGDLTDQSSLNHAVRAAQPDHVYNFGAFTSIGMSWSQPELCMDVTGVGVLRLLEAVRLFAPEARFVQASTADQFGEGRNLSRADAFAPLSPYGVAKQAAHDFCLTYRKAYGMHVSTAIQFNAVSPRLREEFFLRKVTKAVARIKLGLQDSLTVGNLSPIREVGYAPEVAKAYPLIANWRSGAADFVLATGMGHSLCRLVGTAFDTAGVSPEDRVKYDDTFRRPTDVMMRTGSRADADRLGWDRHGPTAEEIIRAMVQIDLMIAGRDLP